MATAANMLALGLEQVSREVRDLADGQTSLISRFKDLPDIDIGQHGYRFAIKTRPAGSAGKVKLNDGTVPDGTDPIFTYMQAGFVDTAMSIRLTTRTIKLSRSPQYLTDVLQDAMKDLTEGIMTYRNSWLVGDGTGKLTEASSSASGTSMVFGSASDYIGTSRLAVGMKVDVWSSVSNKRGAATINEIDHSTGTVTLDNAVSGLATGDFLVVFDADVYGPTTLASGASADYPSIDIGVDADGFGVDSFIHGIEYYHSNATTKTHVLGKAKASYPRLTPLEHAASSGSVLTWDMAHVLKVKLSRRFAGMDDVESKYRCYMAPEQRYQLAQSQLNASTIQVPNGNRQSLGDMSMSVNTDFNFDGFAASAISVINKSRVELINHANWGRVKCGGADAADFSFHKPGGATEPGSIFQVPINTTSGLGKFSTIVTALSSYDYVCHQPGHEMFISGLAVPAIFTS